MDENDCPICYFGFNFIPDGLKDPLMPTITPCDHIFHYRCLLQWGKDCPLCRHPLTQTGNIIKSSIYIHSNRHFKRIEMNLNKLDTISTIKQLLQEIVNIPAEEMIVKNIHTRLQSNSLEVFPVKCDEQILKDVLRNSTLEKFYISFRVFLKSSTRTRVDKKPRKYMFNRRSSEPDNIMEMLRDPEPESDCTIV